MDEIKTCNLLLPGPVVTFRLFKKFSPRKFRSATKSEFSKAIEVLNTQNAGQVATLIVPGNNVKTTVFIKTNQLPADFKSIDVDEYQRKRNTNSPKIISEGLKEALETQGVVF